MHRALLWKRWRELRGLRRAGVGVSVLLGVSVTVMSANDLDAGRDAFLYGIPVMLAVLVWPLLALLTAAQAFGGERSAGTESSRLERPVGRWKTLGARALASTGSVVMVAVATTVLWRIGAGLLFASDAAPASEAYRQGYRLLGFVGSAITVGSLLTGALAASLVSTSIRGVLLAPVFVAVPIGLGIALVRLFPRAVVDEVHLGAVAPWLLVAGYMVALVISTPLDRSDRRGRWRRATMVLGSALLLTLLVFGIGARVAVRWGAGLVATSEAGTGLWSSPAGQDRGWLVDLPSGRKLRFFPQFYRARWSGDGSLLAVVTDSGPLGSVEETQRVEFRDPRGDLAGRTFYPEHGGDGSDGVPRWGSSGEDLRWVGERVVLVGPTELTLLDPWSGEVGKFQRRSVRRRVNALFDEHIFLEPVLAALEGDPSLPDDLRDVVLGLAKSRGDPGSSNLDDRGGSRVAADRGGRYTDVGLGLRLARKPVRLALEDFVLRDTLAWALFANGHFDEAVRESERALELAPEDRKDEFRDLLERLRRTAAEALAASSSAVDEGAGRR